VENGGATISFMTGQFNDRFGVVYFFCYFILTESAPFVHIKENPRNISGYFNYFIFIGEVVSKSYTI
jgi:hypothetical protein